MAKATKTWKIGERAMGGVITVEINGKEVHLIGKEWDTSTGYNRGSNQSNAKEFIRKTLNADAKRSYMDMLDFLCYLTSSYFADQIADWVVEKSEINKSYFC